MGFVSYQLTLTGAAQRLSSAYPGGGLDKNGNLDPTYDVPLRLVIMQGLKANTNDIFVGADNLVSSTKHAFRIDATDSQPPFDFGSFDTGGSKLSDFWVLGTAGEVLTFGGVTY